MEELNKKDKEHLKLLKIDRDEVNEAMMTQAYDLYRIGIIAEKASAKIDEIKEKVDELEAQYKSTIRTKLKRMGFNSPTETQIKEMVYGEDVKNDKKLKALKEELRRANFLYKKCKLRKETMNVRGEMLKSLSITLSAEIKSETYKKV